jgi:hypothetical protein
VSETEVFDPKLSRNRLRMILLCRSALLTARPALRYA